MPDYTPHQRRTTRNYYERKPEIMPQKLAELVCELAVEDAAAKRKRLWTRAEKALRDLEVGSGNAAHLNQYFCVPRCRYLDVTPQDIIDYDLPTQPLKPVNIKRAKDALKNDPFFRHHKEWQKALQQMIRMGVRVEQQAFAAHSLNFVIDEYLPRKLRAAKSFLP